MTPEEFVDTWRGSTRTEISAAHEHFLGLCDLLGVPKPQDEDKHGTKYTFEKSVLKLDGRPGRADVWRKGCFAWEYKGPKKSLVAAYSQLKEYADALENPPLLIVSDLSEIRVHTNFTNSVAKQHTIKLPDLISPEWRDLLRRCFLAPDSLLPSATRESVTRDAARALGLLAAKLRGRKYDPMRVAHFLNRMVFCFFIQDVGLVKNRIFSEILEQASKSPTQFRPMLSELFRAMKNDGGRFGTTLIPWFNGGLFDDDDVVPLTAVEIRDLVKAAELDWSAIEPSIFGSLFEAGLDPEKRDLMASLFDQPDLPLLPVKLGQTPDRGVGIHYTDADTIMRIVEPVVLAPLRSEWENAKAEIAGHLARQRKARTDASGKSAAADAKTVWRNFRKTLEEFRVLDPACGSGNFLYLSLLHLKNFDLQVIDEGKALGFPADKQRITPKMVLGIEANPYAAELARTSVWIGELQWQVKNDFPIDRIPILGSLEHVRCADALLDGASETVWPDADVVVGNPPFVGNKEMKKQLTKEYVLAVRSAFKGRLPGGVDLVTYWFEKTLDLMKSGRVKRAGLVATQAIRRGSNRRALDRILESGGVIYDAWEDEPWIVEGAAVRVSVVCFGGPDVVAPPARLNGQPVPEIHTDLSGGATNLTKAKRLTENLGACFQGPVKVGPFEVTGDLARRWLKMPRNPNGLKNSEVVRPWINGDSLTGRPDDMWIVDFASRSKGDAALFEAPFEHVRRLVKPLRDKNDDPQRREKWWRLGRSGADLRQATSSHDRVIATPRVAKHRFFAWVSHEVLPDSRVSVIARSDDLTFGILQSRFHEVWSLRLGGWHGKGNDPQYTPRMGFETFPFPAGMTLDLPDAARQRVPAALAIAAAAKRLNELRERWLNPPDLVEHVPEVVSGFPPRLRLKSASAEEELKDRTITDLYNNPPTWLLDIHRKLDAAVGAAYGWSSELSDDEIVANLFELNLARSAAQADGQPTRKRRPPTPDELRRAPQFLLPASPKSGKGRQQIFHCQTLCSFRNVLPERVDGPGSGKISFPP